MCIATCTIAVLIPQTLGHKLDPWSILTPIENNFSTLIVPNRPGLKFHKPGEIVLGSRQTDRLIKPI